jgi:small-conductance mechanosensitive channel
MTYNQIQPYLPWACVIVGFVVGVLAEKRFRIIAEEFLSERIKFHGAIVVWFLVLGFLGAVHTARVDHRTVILLHKTIMTLLMLGGALIVDTFITTCVLTYKTRMNLSIPSTLVVLARLIVFACAGLVCLHEFAVNTTPFLTAFGVGGLALSMAMKDALADVLAGVHIIVSRRFKPGDWIETPDGACGCIQDITLSTTTILPLDKNIVIYPNTRLVTSRVINYSKPDDDTAVYCSWGVAYDSDLEKVKEVTLAAANEAQKISPVAAKDAVPMAWIVELSDYQITVKAKLFANSITVKSTHLTYFNMELMKRYRENNISIPFPITTVEECTRERDEVEARHVTQVIKHSRGCCLSLVLLITGGAPFSWLSRSSSHPKAERKRAHSADI